MEWVRGKLGGPCALFVIISEPYPYHCPARLTRIESNENDGQESIRSFGRDRPVGPAICGLLVRNDPRPTEHAVLRFHALRSVQPKSRLLQGDGFRAGTEYAPRRARDAA